MGNAPKWETRLSGKQPKWETATVARPAARVAVNVVANLRPTRTLVDGDGVFVATDSVEAAFVVATFDTAGRPMSALGLVDVKVTTDVGAAEVHASEVAPGVLQCRCATHLDAGNSCAHARACVSARRCVRDRARVCVCVRDGDGGMGVAASAWRAGTPHVARGQR